MKWKKNELYLQKQTEKKDNIQIKNSSLKAINQIVYLQYQSFSKGSNWNSEAQIQVIQNIQQIIKENQGKGRFFKAPYKQISFPTRKIVKMLLRSKESILIEQKQQNIIFALLPARLVNSILEMMEPKEIPNLRGVCKWLKEFIDSNDNLVIMQVFSLFISKQVEFFCEYGDNDIFISERTHKNQLLSYSKYQSKWRHFLKQYEKIRESILDSLFHCLHFSSSSSTEPSFSAFHPSLQFKQKQLLPLEEMPSEKEGEDSILRMSPEKQINDVDFFGEESIEQIEENLLDPFSELKQKNLFKRAQSQLSEKEIQPPSICQKNSINIQQMADLSSKYLWRIFRDPPLPILKLRRENIGGFCNTWFQNKLAEILWEGANSNIQSSEIIGEEFPLKTINSILKENKEFMIEEVKTACKSSKFLKDRLLNFRYYFYKHKTDHFIFTKQHQDTAPSLLSSIGVKRSSFQHPITKSTDQREPLRHSVSISILPESSPSQNSKNLPFNFFNFEEVPDPLFGNEKHPTNFFVLNSHVLPQDEEEKELEALNTLNAVSEKFISTKLHNTPKFSNNANQSSNKSQKEKVPLLLQLVENIVQLAMFKSEISFEFLKGHLNVSSDTLRWKRSGYDLLSEYNIQWRSYSAFLNEIEEQLKDIFEILNDSFAQIFEEYPQHPRISIWRTMVKIWIKNVYEKEDLKENLFGCYFKVLSIRRQENFLFQMKQINLDNKVQKQHYMPDPLEFVSLRLLNNLTKNKNFSLINYGEGYDYQHTFFSKNQYHTDMLLSDFTENILDLSINEISVHYLGHTEIQVDQPYFELEKQLLDSSLVYYQHQQEMFIQNPNTYFTFLEGDLKYVSKIFKERSQAKLKKQMINHWKDSFKGIINFQIPKQLEVFEKREEKSRNLIIQHVKQQMMRYHFEKQQFLKSNEPQSPKLESLSSLVDPNSQLNELKRNENEIQENTSPTIKNSFRNISSSPKLGDYFVELIFEILQENEKKKKSQKFFEIELKQKSNSAGLTDHALLLDSENSNDLSPKESDVNNLMPSYRLDIEQDLPPVNLFPKVNQGGSAAFSLQKMVLKNNCINFKETEELQERSLLLVQLFKLSEDQIKQSISNYIEIKTQEEEESKEKCDQDREIEELNRQRNLPLNLNNDEQAFFFLTKNLTEDIIQETIVKYKEYLETQKKQIQNSTEEEDEANSEEQNSEQENQQAQIQQDQVVSDEEEQEEEVENSQEESSGNNNSNNKTNHYKKTKKISSNSDIPIYNSADEQEEVSKNIFSNGPQFFQDQPQLDNLESKTSNFSLGLLNQKSWLTNFEKEQENIGQEEFKFQENDFDINFHEDCFLDNKKKHENREDEDEESQQSENLLFPQPKQNNMFTFNLKSNDKFPENSNINNHNNISKQFSQNKTNKQHVDLFSSLSASGESDLDQISFFHFPTSKEQKHSNQERESQN